MIATPGKENARIDNQSKRLAKAVAFILAAALATLAPLMLSSTDRAVAGSGEQSHVGLIWDAYVNGSSWEESMKEANLVLLKEGTVPDWIKDEVLDVQHLEGGMSNPSLSVICLSMKGEAKDVSGSLDSMLREKGWLPRGVQCAEDGEGAAASAEIHAYSKKGGRCSWLTAEWAQAGEETTVVLHIEHT